VTDPLAEFVLSEPAERVDQFAEALRRGSITFASSHSQLSYAFVHGGRSLDRMSAVLKWWRREGGTEALLVLRQETLAL